MARRLLRYDRPPLTSQERELIRQLVSEEARRRIAENKMRRHFKGTKFQYREFYGLSVSKDAERKAVNQH